MANISPSLLSNRDLLDATVHAVARERHTTAELLALLAELDTRKLYLGEELCPPDGVPCVAPRARQRCSGACRGRPKPLAQADLSSAPDRVPGAA